MPLLYKYLSLDVPKGLTPPALLMLQTMHLRATDPRTFNDPFEVRPWFDQERHDYAARTSESFHKKVFGVENSLLGGQSMAGFPTEDASGFGEQLNKRFRDDLGRKYRVLCLSKNPRSVLMWGHYAHSYNGIVVGIEPSTPGFNQGLRSDGFEVQYSKDRSLTKLPLAYYQSPTVENTDVYGNIVNNPNEQVRSDGGLFIPFREYRRQVEEVGITALTTKAEDWHYEKEVRYIYDLSRHSAQLIYEDGHHLVSVPPSALSEIIVGFRADITHVRELVRMYRGGKIGSPKLFYSECHPYSFEVQPQETDDQYLLDYFGTILPSM